MLSLVILSIVALFVAAVMIYRHIKDTGSAITLLRTIDPEYTLNKHARLVQRFVESSRMRTDP